MKGNERPAYTHLRAMTEFTIPCQVSLFNRRAHAYRPTQNSAVMGPCEATRQLTIFLIQGW